VLGLIALLFGSSQLPEARPVRQGRRAENSQGASSGILTKRTRRTKDAWRLRGPRGLDVSPSGALSPVPIPHVMTARSSSSGPGELPPRIARGGRKVLRRAARLRARLDERYPTPLSSKRNPSRTAQASRTKSPDRTAGPAGDAGADSAPRRTPIRGPSQRPRRVAHATLAVSPGLPGAPTLVLHAHPRELGHGWHREATRATRGVRQPGRRGRRDPHRRRRDRRGGGPPWRPGAPTGGSPTRRGARPVAPRAGGGFSTVFPSRSAVESDGRERLAFIDGDVPCPPFPEWSQTDRALGTTANLLRRFHEAATGFVNPFGNKPGTPSSPTRKSGPVICTTTSVPRTSCIAPESRSRCCATSTSQPPGRPVYDAHAAGEDVRSPRHTPGRGRRPRDGAPLDPVSSGSAVVAELVRTPTRTREFVDVIGEFAGDRRGVRRTACRAGRGRLHRRCGRRWADGLATSAGKHGFERNRQRFVEALG